MILDIIATVGDVGGSGDGRNVVVLHGDRDLRGVMRIDLDGLEDEHARVLAGQYRQQRAVRVTVEAPMTRTATIERWSVTVSSAARAMADAIRFSEPVHEEGRGHWLSEDEWRRIEQAATAWREATARLVAAESDAAEGGAQ